MEKDYSIINLTSAETGSAIENAVNKLEGIEFAVINFPVRKLKIMGDFSDSIIDVINDTVSAVSPGTEIVPVLESVTKLFEIKNLDCAHCGAEVEEAVKKIDGVDEAVLNYPLKKLKITARFSDELIDEIYKTASKVEPDIEIIPYSARNSQRKSMINEIISELNETSAVKNVPEIRQFSIENLDCAHCGAEIEEALGKLDGVESASLNFPMKKFKIKALFTDELIEKMQKTASEIEPGVELIELNKKEKSRAEDIVRELDEKAKIQQKAVAETSEQSEETEIIEEHSKEHCEEPEFVDEYKEILGDMYNDAPITIKKRVKTVKTETAVSETNEIKENESAVKAESENETENTVVSEIKAESQNTSAVLYEETEEDDEKGTVSIEFAQLVLGIIVFIGAVICKKVADFFPVTLALFIISYLLLGINVLKATVRNVKAKKFFDEKFLMTVATIGAFILGDFPEAVGVMLFYRIGELFEDYAVSKSRKAITETASLKVDEADILVDGEFVRRPSEEIKVGDILRIKVGERIAADGVVESGKSRIDTSAINGEPVPVTVRAGDPIYSGCINLTEGITIRTTASADESMVAKIAEAVEDASASKPSIERFITRFSKIYTPVVLIIALITAIVPSIVTGEWQKWIFAALTFLVISCPCALVLSVPLAYFSGIGAASKLGILFKGGTSIEALAKVKAIAFDKTGTLTNGTFTVTQVQSFGVLGNRHLLQICGSCEVASTHPVAQSIVEYCNRNKLKLGEPEKVSEIAGRGVEAVVSGRTVLCGNERMMREYNVAIPKGQLAESGSVVYIAVNGKAEGRVVVSDSLKKTSSDAIAQLNAMGIHTAMLTGDKKENANITAQKLGVETVKGELLPDEKLKEIENLRFTYGPVMFVGDGINDGPVLAGADVGGAMQSGSDLALEAADAVFINSEPESVVYSKKIADRTQSIAYQNIIFALVIKAAVLVFGLLGMPSMWFAVFADSGTAMLLVLNSVRNLSVKQYKSVK